MKIIFLAAVNLWGSRVGGAGRYERKIVEYMSRKHDLTVIHGQSTDDIGNPPQGICKIELPVSGTSILSRIIAGLPTLVSRANLVVDCSDKGGPWLSPLFAKGPKMLIAHQLWQEIFDYELSAPIASILRRAERRFYRFYEHVPTVVASGRSTVESMRALGIQNVELIGPGLDEDWLSRPASSVVKNDTPTIIVLGRLKAYKGVQFVLLAFKRVLKKLPDAELRIVGDGDFLANLKNLAFSLGISDSVDFMGRVDEATKMKVLSSAHILVNASVREGFGLNVIEANACHTPCVGWNVEGTRDAVRDGVTGLLVTPFSIDELSKAMLTLLLDEDRRARVSENAYQASRQFSWSTTCQKFEAFVSRVV